MLRGRRRRKGQRRRGNSRAEGHRNQRRQPCPAVSSEQWPTGKCMRKSLWERDLGSLLQGDRSSFVSFPSLALPQAGVQKYATWTTKSEWRLQQSGRQCTLPCRGGVLSQSASRRLLGIRTVSPAPLERNIHRARCSCLLTSCLSPFGLR